MAKGLRISIVGCGGIAQRHKMAYETDSDVEIVSVYDVNESAANSFAADSVAPVAKSLQKLIDAGKLGEPVLLRVIFTGGMSLQGNHHADPKLSGGGCLIDNASHGVDLFCHLIGTPARVTAMCGNAVQKIAVEDIGIMLLSTANSKQYGEITTSLSTAVGASRVEWFGTKGTGVVSYWMPDEPELSYRCVDDERSTTVDCEHHPMRFIAEVQHFIACIRESVMPNVTAEAGLLVSQTIEAAYRSSREGVQVAIS